VYILPIENFNGVDEVKLKEKLKLAKAIFFNSTEIPEDAFCNSIEIANAKDTEGYIKIVPVGNFPEHHNGAHEITPKHIKKMAANLKKSGTDILFDYGHESVWNAKAPAAGWTKKADVKALDDGLYIKYPDFTNSAIQKIEDREYRYFSPVYKLNSQDKQGNHIGAELISVALTNTPYMDKEIDHIGNSTINNKSQEEKMDVRLLKLLGLQANASDEEINEKINSLPKGVTLQGLIENQKEENADSQNTNDLAGKVNSLESKVELLINGNEQSKVENLINDAITAGKILPADKKVWLNSAMADYEATKTDLEAKENNCAVPSKVKTPEGEATKVNSTQNAIEYVKNLRNGN